MCCQLSRNTSLTTCAAGAHPLQSNYPSAIAYHILLPPVHQDAMMTPQRAFSQPSNLCCLLFIVVDEVCSIVSLKKRAQLDSLAVQALESLLTVTLGAAHLVWALPWWIIFISFLPKALVSSTNVSLSSKSLFWSVCSINKDSLSLSDFLLPPGGILNKVLSMRSQPYEF